MYLLYADESGNTGFDLDNKSQPILTLAGVMVNDSDWYDLNYMFQKRKEEICPDLKTTEVHTSDIFSASKSTKKGFDFRKYTLDEDLQILENLVDFIVEHKIPIITTSITKSLFKQDCEKKLGTSFKVDPYLYAFTSLSYKYNNYLIENSSNGMIFLDEVQDKVIDINYIYEKLFVDNFDCDTNNVIEKVVYTQSKNNNFIQLADLCAFYINKMVNILLFNSVKNEQKKEHCKKMFDKLAPLIINYTFNTNDLFFKHVK